MKGFVTGLRGPDPSILIAAVNKYVDNQDNRMIFRHKPHQMDIRKAPPT
jgi:hypothetical protein